MAINSKRTVTEISSKRDSRSFNYKKILGFAIFGLLFFSFGYSSRGLDLPGWLESGESSSIKASSSVNVDVEEIYSQLLKKFDGELSDDGVNQGIKRGLVSATGDPYTTYFTKAEYETFESSLNGKFSGIGAEIGKKGDQVVIIAPIDGSPAAAAGIKAGDSILEIDGVSTEGMSVDAAVAKIRGEIGKNVKLVLVSNGERKEIEITRSEIKIDSVKFEKIDATTGYIKISQFSVDTSSLVSQAVNTLRSEGVTKIVLDLRNNGGGYVEQAVGVAGNWLDEKVVLSERFRGREIEIKRTSGTPSADLSNNKLVVLVNEGSASASEILAAALRDNGNVKLVGQKTFGKGSVQEVVELGDGARLKITIAHWFTPKGVSIDKEGIKPDVEVEAGSDPAQDPQKQKALELLAN
jgi:carboxyl-terminal processing protease